MLLADLVLLAAGPSQDGPKTWAGWRSSIDVEFCEGWLQIGKGGGKRREKKEKKKKRRKEREKKVLGFSGFQNPNIYPSRVFEIRFRFYANRLMFSIF